MLLAETLGAARSMHWKYSVYPSVHGSHSDHGGIFISAKLLIKGLCTRSEGGGGVNANSRTSSKLSLPRHKKPRKQVYMCNTHALMFITADKKWVFLSDADYIQWHQILNQIHWTIVSRWSIGPLPFYFLHSPLTLRVCRQGEVPNTLRRHVLSCDSIASVTLWQPTYREGSQIALIIISVLTRPEISSSTYAYHRRIWNMRTTTRMAWRT